jgi:AcrR family transcriptional regulator
MVNKGGDQMPTPDRTSVNDIVAAARDILESGGLPGLTMAAVAARVGVRPPSLYKRVGSRDELIGLVADATVRELGDLLQQLADQQSGDPAAALTELAHGFRSFATQRPAGYNLIFALGPDAVRPRLETLTRATDILVAVTTPLVGQRHALDAARLITAWANGFLSMELSGAFRMGGDIDDAFDYGVGCLVQVLRGQQRGH